MDIEMNIDGGTSKDLKEGMEVVISQTVIVTEVGGNYITVSLDNGDELDITESEGWFIKL